MSLKKDLFSGVFYTAVARYSGLIVSLVIAGVLARLIPPEDFGVVAVATVIISFFGIFSDLGVGAAVIQNKILTDGDLSKIYSFTVWTGVLLAVLFFAASWPIAAYYEKSILKSLCQWLSVNLLFASVNIVPNALLHKAKRFRFLAVRNLVVQVGGGAVSIVAALCGAGLYALIVNPILSSVLLFVLSYRAYPQRLRPTFGLDAIRKIFSFSAYQFLFNAINYFSRNLDKLLIGKCMGMTPLGYYEKSYRLMMLPLQNITHVISPVMHPVFSEFQHDLQRVRTSYEKIVRLLAFIGFPLSVFLWFAAQEVVLIIFGSQWMPSVPVFRILSLSVGVQIVLASSGGIFQAANDTRSLFVSGAFSATLNVAGILVGIFVFRSLEAVAWCICVTFTINFVQCYWMMYRVTFAKSRLSGFCRQLVSPLAVSGILVLLLGATTALTKDSPELVGILAKGAVFLLTLFVYLQVSGEYDILAKLKRKSNPS